ncbi:MAG TPA: histidine kinase [Gemmatimonadaceae bacterium]
MDAPVISPPRLTLRLALAVCGALIAAGLILGAQASLGATLQGGQPVPLPAAMRPALIQTMAWIPATLAAIVLATRFPLDTRHWRRHAGIHVLAAVLLAFVTNALVVLGYWVTAGQFGGMMTLVRQGALWMTLRLHVALAIYAAILAITQAVISQRRSRERELRLARLEGQLTRARLQALNAQIRPHFLLNTMHTIGQLWRSGQADMADEMLDRLGNLFHRVQDSTDQQEVPLADELETVREYLAIEQARFPDRLRYTIDASTEALETLVPPLILQPLVENAVRHGVSRASTAGRIDVRASVDNGSLSLVVSDDGPGFRQEASENGGTGLRNTRERLEELYGRHGHLDIRRRGAIGTVATVVIPQARGA